MVLCSERFYLIDKLSAHHLRCLLGGQWIENLCGSPWIEQVVAVYAGISIEEVRDQLLSHGKIVVVESLTVVFEDGHIVWVCLESFLHFFH